MKPNNNAETKKDRRVYVRLTEKDSVCYRLFNSKGEPFKEGYYPELVGPTKNISAGGVLFVSDEVLPVKCILELRIELANSERIMYCLARVVRVNKTEGRENWWNVAVCFLDMLSADRAYLNGYVIDRLRDHRG